jgi:dTDP-4-dehydrorhamnose 3,5-epimerase
MADGRWPPDLVAILHLPFSIFVPFRSGKLGVTSSNMQFTETTLPGAYIIDPTIHEDPRGLYIPTFSRSAFAAHNCNPHIEESNLSTNKRAGTLRGMHYQADPHAQSKLVRCTRGAIWDAIIDLRPASPTFKQWIGVELSANNRRQLYIPEGFAHGFITLEDDSEVLYQMGSPYHATAGRGVRHNDPAFNIHWPRPVTTIIDRDNTYPDFVG